MSKFLTLDIGRLGCKELKEKGGGKFEITSTGAHQSKSQTPAQRDSLCMTKMLQIREMLHTLAIPVLLCNEQTWKLESWTRQPWCRWLKLVKKKTVLNPALKNTVSLVHNINNLRI